MGLVLAVPAARSFTVVVLGKVFFVAAAFIAMAFVTAVIAFIFVFLVILFVVAFAFSLPMTVGQSQSGGESEAACRAHQNPFCVFHRL
jgi:hypothetical protein